MIVSIRLFIQLLLIFSLNHAHWNTLAFSLWTISVGLITGIKQFQNSLLLPFLPVSCLGGRWYRDGQHSISLIVCCYGNAALLAHTQTCVIRIRDRVRAYLLCLFLQFYSFPLFFLFLSLLFYLFIFFFFIRILSVGVWFLLLFSLFCVGALQRH